MVCRVDGSPGDIERVRENLGRSPALLVLNPDSECQAKGVRMPYLTSWDGGRINYDVYGNGRPIVFVHGWGIARVWKYQVAEFSRDHMVVTVDIRGHGDSCGPRGDYSLDKLGEDLTAVIKKLRLERVTLVGWSMGASVVMKLMAEKNIPEVVSIVIIGGTPMFTASYRRSGEHLTISKKQGLLKVLFRVSRQYALEIFRRRDFLKNRLWIVKNCGPWTSLRTMWGYMKTMAKTDLTGILSDIKVPTLILHGDSDIMCPVEGSYYMAERIKGSRLEILHGDDHSLGLTDPERVNRKIREFVE